MFYKIQFPDIQLAAESNVANDQAELQRYALNASANQAAVKIRQDKIESRVAYINFVAELVNELEIEIARSRSAGYTDGRQAEYRLYYPNDIMGTTEQRRAANILNAMQTWPELF